MSWVIRTAVEHDARALSELAERTFRDAFGGVNARDDVDLHCARAFAPDIQAREIKDPAIETLVVEHEGALVAFAQLRLSGESPPCVTLSPAVELQRIYVDRRWHGTGLARELMTNVFERTRKAGAKGLWLGVWEHNARAIRFYKRVGFSEVGDQVFRLGNDPQRDVVMVALPSAFD